MPHTPGLFGDPDLPEGFKYQEDFLASEEEREILDRIRSLAFHEVKMRGTTARRRAIQYGWKYDLESFRTSEGPPFPGFLVPIRDRAARFASVPAASLSEALLMEYPPGAPIGWHRDAPTFGIVVGISLLAPCRFRFRRGEIGAWETRELILAPRSAYVLQGAARSQWQHSIPPVSDLRYSITFRTLRSRRSADLQSV